MPGAAQPARSAAQQRREATTTVWHGAERASVRLKSEQGTTAPEHSALRTRDTEDTQHLKASQGSPRERTSGVAQGEQGQDPPMQELTDGVSVLGTEARATETDHGVIFQMLHCGHDPVTEGFTLLSPSGGCSSLWRPGAKPACAQVGLGLGLRTRARAGAPGAVMAETGTRTGTPERGQHSVSVLISIITL